MRAIAEYQIRDRETWLVALGRDDADGTDTYDELAAWLMSEITDCVAVRPRGGRFTDNAAAGFRGCSVCGSSYWAKRKDSKFCGPTCRQRASRSRRLDPAPPATTSGAGITTLADLLDSANVCDAPELSAYAVFAAPRRTRRGYRSAAPTPATVKASASTLATRSGASSSTPTNHKGTTR